MELKEASLRFDVLDGSPTNSVARLPVGGSEFLFVPEIERQCQGATIKRNCYKTYLCSQWIWCACMMALIPSCTKLMQYIYLRCTCCPVSVTGWPGHSVSQNLQRKTYDMHL